MTLPDYVAIALEDDEHVISYLPCDSFEQALGWCSRAMTRYKYQATSVLIGKPHIVRFIAHGEGPRLAPIQGWRRVDMTWRAVPADSLSTSYSYFGRPDELLDPHPLETPIMALVGAVTALAYTHSTRGPSSELPTQEGPT